MYKKLEALSSKLYALSSELSALAAEAKDYRVQYEQELDLLADLFNAKCDKLAKYREAEAYRKESLLHRRNVD